MVFRRGFLPALLVALCVTLISSSSQSAVIRVKPHGDDSNDGSSWKLAKKTVTAAIAGAFSGDEIWVAAGVYYERITLKDGVAIYGGFAGNETEREQRNWTTNESILDGNQQGSVVVSPLGAGQTTRIDGFVVRCGNSTNVGGGILCSASSPVIANNTIIGNSAERGGVISCLGSSPTISNNTISGNSAKSYGGGIFCAGSSPAIFNNTITGCSAVAGGGIYCQSSSSPRVVNNIIAYNSSGIFVSGGNPIFRNNCAYNPGGYNYSGVSADPTDIQLDPILVGVGYGQVHIQPDSPCVDAGDDSVVQPGWVDMDGQARTQGAHVDIGADESDGTVWQFSPRVVYVSTSGNDSNDGLSWSSAKRSVQAGIDAAAALLGADVWVAAGVYNERIALRRYVHVYGGFAGSEDARDKRDRFTNTTVLDGNEAGSVVTASGIPYRTATIDGFTVRNGKASNGGGISCYYYSSPAISNNAVSNNNGSGVYCSHYSSPEISNNEISGNTGGGIYSENSSPTISTNQIVGNTADYGGGIRCYSSSPTVSNNTIAANSASRGGGIYCSNSTPSICDNAIVENRASLLGGAAICCEGSSATIRDNRIYSNCAPSGSGAIYCFASEAVISGNTIAGNSAASGGAIAIFNGYGRPVTISKNTLSGNTALGAGGAIYCTNSSATISNNVITGNNASISASMYCYESSIVFSNNTVAVNSATTGGALSCSYVSGTISNNIISFNTSGISDSGSNLLLKNNCVYNPEGYDYSHISPGENDISVDPVFVSLSKGDYRLLGISPCINSGWNDVPDLQETDADGLPRIWRGVVDIGAYEYHPRRLGEIKLLEDECAVTTEAATVTAVFGNVFYVESPCRTAGMRVYRQNHGLTQGALVSVRGIIRTNADTERYIEAAEVTILGAGAVEPLAMRNQFVGGADLLLPGAKWVTVSYGQKGVEDGCGLNNIGLLVTTWGKVSEADAYEGCFRINDGFGANTKCIVPEGTAVPEVGDLVGVTGISSCENAGGQVHRLIRLRGQSDIAVFKHAPEG